MEEKGNIQAENSSVESFKFVSLWRFATWADADCIQGKRTEEKGKNPFHMDQRLENFCLKKSSADFPIEIILQLMTPYLMTSKQQKITLKV